MLRKKHLWGRLLFFMYCLWMLWLLYGQRLDAAVDMPFSQYWEQSVNLRPFHTIRNYWYVMLRTKDRELFRHIVVNLVGNVVMFLPLGFFLPVNWERFRNWRKLIAWAFGIIFCIELLQMATMLGSFDVDDVILNLAGCVLGYFVWKIMNR